MADNTSNTTTTFVVNKANVYTEVAKTTSYTGMKMAADGSSYEQIFTTDEDRLLLERFWNEAGNAMVSLFKPFVTVEGTSFSSLAESHGVNLSENFTIVAEMPKSYVSSLTNSIESSMFSFFVNYIVSQWYRFANKSEAEEFGTLATAMHEDIRAKIYYRNKPTRTAPTDS